MSKKNFTLLIIAIIAIFAIIGWYLYMQTKIPDGTELPDQNDTSLFPFGTNGGASNQGTNGEPGNGTTTVIDLDGVGQTRQPRLRQISFVPTAGAVASSTASSTVIRYVERATGHIYQVIGGDVQASRISGVTIPKIYEAIFTADGNKLLLRYLTQDTDIIRTFYAKIATTSRPEQALEGLFLPDGIANVSVYNNKIFYLAKTSGGEQGIVANLDGSSKVAVFTSAFGDWASHWTSKDAISLYSKPSAVAQGAGYLLNPSNGTYTKTIGGLEGLSTLASTDGTIVLFSSSNQNGTGLSALHVKTGVIQPLGLAGLADKCIWSQTEKATVYCAVPQSLPNGTYPDDWYKGKISFDDILWKIDTSTGEAKELINPGFANGTPIDMIRLSLDHNDQTIIFTNKKDMFLWGYDLVD